MEKIFTIGEHAIGGDNPCYIIAEISANHNQDIDRLLGLIDAAKEVGADAVKIQTYTADTITLPVKNEYFLLNHGTAWDGQYLHDLYQTAQTPFERHEAAFAHAKKVGITLFSTPYDLTAVDLLEKYDVPAYKIASYEIVNIPLIKDVAAKGKPIIFSTGIARQEDIELALETIKVAGNDQIAILKCTSGYPAPLDEINLRTMADMGKKYDVIVGLSDHTSGSLGPVLSIIEGAKIIEKHITFKRSDGGPDAHFSMEKEEFAQMVQDVRHAEKMLGSEKKDEFIQTVLDGKDAEKILGTVNYQLTSKNEAHRAFAASLWIAENVKKGDTLTPKNCRVVRPGAGIHPKYYEQTIGKVVNQDLVAGTPFTFDLVD